MRRSDKKQVILEAHLRIEEDKLIKEGILKNGELEGLRQELREEFGDDPELINEALGTITTLLGILGIGLSIGKGVDALGFIYRKMVEFFSGKEKLNKTKAEKFGEKYHEAIIKGITWILKKSGFEPEVAEKASNIVFWSIIGVTFGFGGLPSSVGVPIMVLKKVSTMVKSYEMGILIVSGILWWKMGEKLKESDFPKLVHAVEHCVEDEHISVYKMKDLGECSMKNLEQ